MHSRNDSRDECLPWLRMSPKKPTSPQIVTKSALEFTQEGIEGLLTVNLFSAFYCARVADRAFIAQNVKGAIVFTASMALPPQQARALDPLRFIESRRAKHTHKLAMGWAKYGISVNSVIPGLVKTVMTYWVPEQPNRE